MASTLASLGIPRLPAHCHRALRRGADDADVRDFTPVSLLTAWTASPSGILAVVVAAGVYGRWLLLARGRGLRWSGWRIGLYYGLGVGSLTYALCGPLAVYRDHIFWDGALQVGVLASLTPVGLALGDPVRLLRRLHPDGRHWMLRLLAGPVPRVLMFPAVGTALAVGIIIAVFFTPWFQSTTQSSPARWLLDLVLLTSGLLFVLPLMVDELLPAWATPGCARCSPSSTDSPTPSPASW